MKRNHNVGQFQSRRKRQNKYRAVRSPVQKTISGSSSINNISTNWTINT